jgi:Xaa-Pro aminopeptidase
MNRIEKVQLLLKEKKLDAIIVDNVVDLFYFLGHSLSLGRIVIEPHTATLFVDGRYFAFFQKNACLRVIQTNGYGKGTPFANWWNLQGKKIAFDADYSSYTVYENLLALESDLFPLHNPIQQIRQIKEPSEIEKLKQAASLGSKGFDFVCSLLNEGVTERDLALELEIFWRRSGGEKVAFAPHIAFGEGSAYPHYHPDERKLKKGDAVLIDIGVVWQHYHSDMTRVVFYGEPPAQMDRMYQIVRQAFESAVSYCRPGVKAGDLDQCARKTIEENGYGEYFSHSLGHGVGLEIHELPRIRSIGEDAEKILQAGMVITIEPGIYLPEVGGVRLEDTFLITSDGCESLTKRPFDPLRI